MDYHAFNWRDAPLRRYRHLDVRPLAVGQPDDLRRSLMAQPRAPARVKHSSPQLSIAPERAVIGVVNGPVHNTPPAESHPGVDRPGGHSGRQGLPA